MREVVGYYRDYLKLLGYSESSIHDHPRHLKQFLVYAEKKAERIEREDVEEYYAYLQIRPNQNKGGALSENFIYSQMSSLKLFFNWWQEIGRMKVNPMSALRFPVPEKKQREILTIEEIKELYEVATLSEKALLSVYYGCGLRRAEGANLEIRDLKFRAGMLYVRNGKGGKRRGVPMSKRVKEDLLNYIEKERKGNVNELRLFVHQGKGITAGSCSRRFKKLLAKTTIEKDVSLHHLRHSIATHLLERGLSVDYVKEFLGHKSLETTQIYTRVL